MIGKIMFMMEMIILKLNEEEAEEFIGGFTVVVKLVVALSVSVLGSLDNSLWLHHKWLSILL